MHRNAGIPVASASGPIVFAGVGLEATLLLGAPMIDYHTQLEKLRRDAAECTLIADLATSPQKRELFARLAEHLGALAVEVERAMTAANENAPGSRSDLRS